MEQALRGCAEYVSDGSADVLVAGRPEETLLDEPALKAVVVPFAGVPSVTLERMQRRRHLALYNLSFNAPIVAELALGLLVAAARGIASGDRALREGRWQGRQDDFVGVHLSGRTATILGYGSLGRRVGVALEALGVHVLGVARTSRAGAFGFDELDQCLDASNFLFICAPSTSQTRGAIERARIQRLRPPRILVNVGRGDIVDEESLYEACRDGTLFGAGLDVWYAYPGEESSLVMPSQYAFHELGNVVMSPHRGGASDRTEELRALALADLIEALARGEKPRSVDVDAGY
ncbi:MAG TPA: NAD(P)-dependent oxidoreductase [Fimbriimonadaceae bacterium]|nr:NAD(P)-dependent oxidoreductase [Fimbriimonadaceae bacterium]HRJ96761.1 NAD(P)-dependent oxidoreductase [Fimbriimonadaceae bacterium]